ncbi:hypothetical protein HWB96_gp12 [Arthrobacter phage Mendel]|uniref:Uncharacterized protein n=1 Tax=Arthrobacter phage Mendel TaxID=2484218 RepID=A0A3G3M0Z7_9CAUD|nr:hypothetical protein HWB96_gp12 [Arthrobacter phage Mendel]AYQ99926.1 hypothetical protein PBI_MENDEL_12 [Arthrobacter phage Mendel]
MEFTNEELALICRALNTYKPSMKYNSFDEIVEEIKTAENLAARIYKERLRLQ